MFDLTENHINRVLTDMSEGLKTELKALEELKILSDLTCLVRVIQSSVEMLKGWCRMVLNWFRTQRVLLQKSNN